MTERTADERAGAQAPARAAGDLAVGLVIIAVCVWAGWESLGMPRRGQLGLLTSPGFTPFLACLTIGVLCAILVVRALLRGALKGVGPRLAEMWHSEESRRVVVLFALITGYGLLVGVIQFAVVTGVFLLVCFVFVRAGGWVTIAATTVVATLLTGVAIPHAFSMPLP
ncbi:hypothetical protein F4561_000349 [Lipingzhangella halophila]|uniref:DUF1468 domain-containing protein n=1 Tax=Lipingzhangella halophila TaxID=1783352 RepID=A0A7W7RCR7_9ACTN|nr:tripartite tricarboxylate transporter TctB family protein [Lipingzhangella halophila]MBB4929529.1 hypothetical protein [Lipingzhangella halophila]